MVTTGRHARSCVTASALLHVKAPKLDTAHLHWWIHPPRAVLVKKATEINAIKAGFARDFGVSRGPIVRPTLG